MGGHHLTGQRGQVHGHGRVGQHGASCARQCQQLAEHMAGVQRVLAYARQRGALGRGIHGAGRRIAQGTRLQGDGGQRRAQFMGHFVGQAALALQRLLLAVQQGVDGVHHGHEFPQRVAVRDALGLGQVQALDLAREFVERPHAASNGQPQRQRDHRQKPQARLDHLARDVVGQFVALLQLDHHADLACMVAAPLGEAAPGPMLGTQAQGGKALLGVEGGLGRIARARDQPPRAIPQGHAQRLLVVVGHEAGGLMHGRGCSLAYGACDFQVEHQRSDAGQVAVGQLVCLVHAGLVAQCHEAGPDHDQRAQHPGHQMPDQRGAALLRGAHGFSAGRK